MATRTIPQKLNIHIQRFSSTEKQLISRAYLFAREKHHGQKRKSGKPYITHPVNIASRIAQDNYDAPTVAAALLHDTLEDTGTTYDELAQTFSTEIANLVDGVSKIAALRAKSKALTLSNEEMFLKQVDNYRKILLAGASDIRVMIIRLYDRLDNVSTLQWIAPHKQQFYARETIEIYAPIAERLGMGVVKGQLEDLSFPYAYPDEYQQFIKVAKPAYQNPQKVINDVIPVIKTALDKAGIKYDSIAGRAKHYYSLFNKMKQGKSINNIFDIIALRIIVYSVEDCYKTLGIVHNLYEPLPGQIDDYIARPKESGYQSLHTTVSDTTGNVFEIQMRTVEMHEINEYGPAAHWSYKDGHTERNIRIAERNRKEWLDELGKIKNIHNKKELIQQIKEELFSRQVFVFSPKGKIVKLPSGSCGLDFAYQIHSEVGNACAGIKINNRLMPISTQLQTGDIVEIITSKKASPSPDWLKIVKTSSAKHHIRTALRTKNHDALVTSGEKIISEVLSKNRLPAFDRAKADTLVAQSNLPYQDLTAALIAIAEGALNKVRLVKVLHPDFSTTEHRKTAAAKTDDQPGIVALKHIRHVFAGCCKPSEQDHNIIGYLSKEHVIKVHRKNCRRISSVDKRRLIDL